MTQPMKPLGRVRPHRTLRVLFVADEQNLAPEARATKAEGPSPLIGGGPPMQEVHRLLTMVAPTDATVLILGETGCGKELAARAVWQLSKRANMPFIPVNCGALAENLV